MIVSLGGSTASAQPYFYDPDILARLNQYGCAGCHGGSGGLEVTPYSNILTTGNHGPVVVPFDTNSVIVRKLKGTAGFGSRMPFGGPFLSDAEIQVFVQWILNGALETAPTSADGGNQTPLAFSLGQNYPNPFNPTTNIRFRIAEPSVVKLTVFDHLGRMVAVLADGRMDAGSYDVTFDAGRGTGAGRGAGTLASGVYIYRLQAGSFVETKKMIVVK
jgi:hypothetical protein